MPMALIEGASCFLLQIIVQCLPLKRLSNEMDLAESDIKRKKVFFKGDDPRFFLAILPILSHVRSSFFAGAMSCKIWDRIN